MSSSLAMSGVFSQINTDTLVQAAVAARSRQLNRLKSFQTTNQKKEQAFGSVKAAVESLSSLADTLADRTALRKVQATSSDASKIGVTVSSQAKAVAGDYELLVNHLASSDRFVQAGLDPTETWMNKSVAVAVSSGTYLTADQIDAAGDQFQFQFQFGSSPAVTVDLSAYDATGISLDQLVTEINTAAGYTAATAIQDGSQWRLQLQASQSGSGQALTIDANHAVALMDSLSGFQQLTVAATSTDPLVGAGTFVYTYHGTTRTIVTAATTTVSGLADLINKDSGNPGASATVMTYQGAVGGKYHLMLAGNQTGADYGITIEAGTTLSAFAPGAAWTHTQTARSAEVRIDGAPAGSWIESDSNTLTDLVPGLTVTLQASSPDTPIVIGVKRDTSSIGSQLSSLVAAYNSLADVLQSLTGYDTTKKVGGILQGDSTLMNLLDEIRTPLVSAIPGYEAGRDTFRMAADIGLTVDKTGHLSLDQDKLSAAIQKDYNGVLNLLANASSGVSADSDLQFGTALGTTQAGTYELRVTYNGDGSIASADMRPKGQADWDAAGVEGNSIIGLSGRPEAGMSWKVVHPQAGTTATYEVSLQQGFGQRAKAALDDVLGTHGMFATREKADADADKDLANRIAAEQQRVDQYQADQKAKYARMETALAKLDQFRGAFAALTAGITDTSTSSSKN